MKRIKILSVGNFLALIVHIMLAYITQLRIISGKDVGQVSDQYNSLFTPAGITFAIWGIIYIALLIYCVYHLIVAFRYGVVVTANKDVQHTGGWFMLNNLGAAAWLLAWVNEMIGVALLLICFQLITLIVIHVRTGIYNPERSRSDLLFSQFPLSIYFAWITIATIANASVYLLAINWSGWGITPTSWAVTMICVAVVLNVLVIVRRHNAVYGLVIVWALYGIMLKRLETDPITYEAIIRTAWIGIAIVSLTVVLQFIRNAKKSNTVHLNRNEQSFPLAKHSLK
jgi:hypothetical protein